MKEVRRRYDEGQRPNFVSEHLDVHTTASLLKLYFRELPEPVIPYEHFESFLSLATSFKYNSNHQQTFENLKSLVNQIPEENYRLLDFLTGFLFEISKYQEVNKMTEKNIAVIFGTNILRGLDDTPEFQMATQNLTTHVVLALVKWHELIFDKIPPGTETKPVMGEKEFEQLVSLSEEPTDHPVLEVQTSMTSDTGVVGDLLGIDFTTEDVSNEPKKEKTPPPIPERRNLANADSPDSCASNNVEQRNSADSDMTESSEYHTPRTSGSEFPIPPPRSSQEGTSMRRKGGSVHCKPRPTAIVQPELSPTASPACTPPQSISVNKLERTPSNFTSFIDSPLDPRFSLNIGDLPGNVDDLQALVLSLKIQLKEQKKAMDQQHQQMEGVKTKYKQQLDNLASTINRERQSKDEAVTRVVKLVTQLTQYQSKFGMLEDL